ncbi:hypothetical protein RFI_02920, partial [Reticulomyxa filosa]
MESKNGTVYNSDSIETQKKKKKRIWNHHLLELYLVKCHEQYKFGSRNVKEYFRRSGVPPKLVEEVFEEYYRKRGYIEVSFLDSDSHPCDLYDFRVDWTRLQCQVVGVNNSTDISEAKGKRTNQ